MIKSHHNEGLQTSLKLIQPLHEFFKYEVRSLASALSLPSEVSAREPFPGPGLFIRIIGMPVAGYLLDTLRWADAEVRAILKTRGQMESVSQLVVALIGVRTTGIKGDKRAYAYPIVVRAVTTADFMTARGYDLPIAVKEEIVSALTRHDQIGRVWFDVTPKPPGTVEFE